MRSSFCLALICSLPSLTYAAVDFQREVRPILSDACFHCHGPDKNTRMAGLRLDTREGAFAERKSGTPIVAGKPAESLIIQRITHEQKARRMPPESSHKTLTPKQIDTLKRWVAEGATWKEHWAFTAPVRPQPPAVVNKTWAKTPIDRFILAKLEKQALTPAAPADRRTLIRRVTLDLTGLPPDPEDVEAFVADTNPNAYEKFVDRLLASDMWGEHRGRYWLDAARYADTHGIHIDNYREMWPYRDWVIKAFNRNMPFDQFTVEQLAGDLLPNPTLDQLIATGFHRCNITTNEGGVIPEEVEAIYAKDRVETTGTVFLGLTVGCAACHDHKFDPISQKDFYSMAAFFSNTTQNALDGNISDTPPIIVVPRRRRSRPVGADRGRGSQAQGADGQSPLATRQPTSPSGSTRKHGPKISGPVDPADEAFALSAHGCGDSQLQEQAARHETAGRRNHRRRPHRRPEGTTLHGQSFARISEHRPASPPISPFTLAAWVQVPKGEDRLCRRQSDRPGQQVPRTGLSRSCGRRPTLRIAPQSNRTLSLRTGIGDRLKPGQWVPLAVTYDGSRDAGGLLAVRQWQVRHGRRPLRPGNHQRRFPHIRAASNRERRSQEVFRWRRNRRPPHLRSTHLTEEEMQVVALWPVIDNARTKPPRRYQPTRRTRCTTTSSIASTAIIKVSSTNTKHCRKSADAIAKRGTVTHVQHERPDEAIRSHPQSRHVRSAAKKR